MTDLEGHVTRINCPEYVQSNGTCRLKAPEFQAGPLSRLLVQAAGQDLGARDALCDLGAA
jgi:hypothetical protein